MDTEIRKVAEEVASAEKAKVEKFVKLLEVTDSDEKLEWIRQSTDTTELQQKIYNLLQEWLQSQHQHQTDGDTHDRGETFQPEGSAEQATPSETQTAASAQMDGNNGIEQATLPEAETSTEEASPTPRRLLVRHLHRIGLKITGEG